MKLYTFSCFFCLQVVLLITIQLFFYTVSFGQTFCSAQPANEIGNFEIVGSAISGCSPFKVELKDNSGGQNIRYDFYYDGRAADKLEKVKNTALSNFYFTDNTSKTYTILQYGEKNGKPMFACKTITVLPGNKPDYSYSVCSSQLEIVIPKNAKNNFNSYKIDWGSGNSISTINANQLPYSESKPVSYPTQIKVEGIYTATSTLGCNLNTGETIQKLDATNFPNGIDLPFDPNIEEIVAINAREIVLKFKGSEDAAGYNLNRRPLNWVYTSNAFMTNVLPGDIKVNLPDSTNSYCFYLTRVAKCGSFEESAEVCTIAQKKPMYNSGNLELLWSEYPTKIREYNFVPNQHSFTKKVSLEKEWNGVMQPISVASNSTSYLDKVTCPKSLRYRVKIEISGLLIGYQYKSVIYSNWQEVDINQIKAKAITDLMVTVNSTNQPEVIFKNNANWDTKIKKYYLFEMTNNIPILMDSSQMEVIFSIKNKNAAEDSYCFKVGYIDDCGIKSDLSPEVCNLSLTELDDVLSWKKANPFAEDVISTFEIESKEETLSSFQKLEILSSSTTTYTPNLSSFENEAFFRLKALDTKNGKISFSNSLEIPINQEVYLPSAFSPDGNGHNDTFYVLGNITKITDYSLTIYNRWGEKIYSNANPSEKWLGKNQVGKDVPIGIYFCEIKFVDKYKLPQFIKKEIFLLR